MLKALLGDSFDHSPILSAKNESVHQSRHDSLRQSRQEGRIEHRPNESFGSINNGSRFDTFLMARTLSFINDEVLGESRMNARISSQTCTRNKVAFFKNSLVLLR
jgi:hypothetical protein